MNDLAGRALDYLIGRDGAAPVGSPGRVVEVAFDCDTRASLGPTIGYCNLLDEENRASFGPYRPQTDTARQYNEGVPDPAGPGFEANLRAQFERRKRYGFEYVELDNPDAYALADVMRATALAESCGLKVIAKNPLAMDVDATSWLAHPNVHGVIVEKGAGTAQKMDDLRVAAGKPELPVWFVFFGDGRPGAEAARAQIANATIHGPLRNMGVTFDRSPKEYGGDVEDILLPIASGNSPIKGPGMSVPAQLAALQTFDGSTWSSGPPPAFIKQMLASIAVAWPSVPGLPAYCNSAANESGYWSACGCGAAYAVSKAGYQPVFGADDLHRMLWAEAWLDWGAPVPVAQAQPGDVAIFDFGGGDHHVSIVQENRGSTLACYGANQGHKVTLAVFMASSCQGIRRPSGAAQGDPYPEIKIGAMGDAVSKAQGLLGLPVTGTFDQAMDAAVRAYQAARGLGVDGEIGVNTWGALRSGAPVIPVPAVGGLSADLVAKITALAGSSPLASYAWHDRGRAPIGYIKGMAVAFAKVYLDLKSGGSAALAMAAALTTDGTKDALIWYGVTGLTSRASTLRALFCLLIGLGMRESDGDCYCGVDTSAGPETPDEAEAGLFQQSWNSRVASAELPKLFAAYSAAKTDGYLAIFREGLKTGKSGDLGSGDAATYQSLAKTCPLFSVEFAAVGLRTIGGGPSPHGHWGPIRARAAELRPEADALLQQVQATVDAVPPPKPDPIVILPPIKPEKPMPDNPIPSSAAVEGALAQIRPILAKLAAAPDNETIRKYLRDLLADKPGAPIALPAPPAPAPDPSAPVVVTPSNPSGVRTDLAVGTLGLGGALAAWLTGVLNDPQALTAAITTIIAAVKGRDILKATGGAIQAGAQKALGIRRRLPPPSS